MPRLVADWLDSAPARAVAQALEGAGHQALFVGGCVRNTLLGVPVTDLDVATDAHPEAVLAVAEGAGLKAVPTGIGHGTITLIHDDGPVEVTTFRDDVETFGRHATVRFSTDVEQDARRRDFTMNALYADIRGDVQDPVGQGLADLAARRLRFVGDPEQRVHEDYLRILRFFRFHAWYADPAGGMDADAVAACAQGAGGLDHVSAERLGAEMKKLLSAPDPSAALGAMGQTGVLAHVLPGADPAPVARLVHLHPEPDAILRLAALGGGDDVADRLRLSRPEARRREALLAAATCGAGAAELAWRHGAGEARAAVALRAALTGAPLPGGLEPALAHGARATFPVKPADLMPAYTGAALGARLARLERAWIASGMHDSRESLLALPDPALPDD